MVAKRSAQAPSGGAQKKVRVDPMFEGVSQAIELAQDLPESCKAMLGAMIPETLGVVKEDRSGTQGRVVEMIGEVVGRVQTKIEQDHEKELQQLSKIEGSKSQLDRNLDEAGDEVVKASEALDNLKQQLANAYSTQVSRKSELAQAKEAQEIGDAPLAAVREEKQRCEAILEEEFKVVRQGTAHTQEQSDKLIALAGKLSGMDESLLHALPSSCCKTSADRGAFDNMVLDTLAKSVEDHVSSLAASLTAAATGVHERAAVVETATIAMDAALAEQQRLANDVATAQKELQQAETKLDEARAAVKNFDPEVAKAKVAVEEKRSALENFNNWNTACYEMLRDKTKLPPAAPIQSDIGTVAEPDAGVTVEPDAGTIVEPSH